LFRVISNVRPNAENHSAEVTVRASKDFKHRHVLLEQQIGKLEAGVIKLSRKSLELLRLPLSLGS
jgi:hypothetical protein